MSKNKTRSEVEHLRGLVKQQRSIIKNLKKEIERQNKRSASYHDLEERTAEEELTSVEIVKVTTEEVCPDCGKEVEPVELGVRKLIVCKSCGYRKTVKKNV